MMGHADARPARGPRPSPTRTSRRRPDGKIHFVRVRRAARRRRRAPRRARPAVRAPTSCAAMAAANAPGRAARRRRRRGRRRGRRHPARRPRSIGLRPRSRSSLAPMTACRPGRHVRPRAPRPAHLGHRPLQLPLHLLHAGRGHGRGCPATELLTFEEIERVARRAASSASASTHPPHRRRADRAGPPAGARREARRRSASTWRSPPTAPRSASSPTTSPRPGCAGSTSRSTRCAATASSS